MKNYMKMVEKCTHGQAPACTVACPFDLDVRSMVARIQRGKVDSAWRIYRDAVMFPGIVSRLCPAPCQQVCERCEVDSTVMLKLLERSLDELATGKDPATIRIPAKDKRIAIVGGGMAGLACALRLAERNYQVTLFEATGRIGGSLWDKLEEHEFMPEIEQQFKNREYELRLSTPITSLGQLGELDPHAVFVTAPIDDATQKLLDEAQVYPPLKVNGNVFFGGSVLGADTATSIRHGGDAANMIEMYLNTGNCLNLVRDYGDVRNRPDPQLLVTTPPTVPASGLTYSKEELVEEAKRCVRCDCDICMTRCPLMIHYDKSPVRIADNVRSTVNPTDVLNHRVATRLIASCDQCGICKDVCPHDVSVKDVCIDARQVMMREGTMPRAFTNFWLADLDQATGPDASIVAQAPGSSECDIAFFPGCQLGAVDPRYVTQTYGLLRQVDPSCALMLTCCGAPAYWSGDEQLHQQVAAKLEQQWRELGQPTLVCACPTCKQMLDTYLPQCESVLLYEPGMLQKLEQVAGEVDLSVLGELSELGVFDPCTARFDGEVQRGVRELVAHRGLELAAPNVSDPMCCGWGGQYMQANEAMATMEAGRAASSKGAPIVTYCANCRTTLHAQTGSCVHALDLLLGLNGPDTPAPTVTQRRINRQQLKAQLLQEVWMQPAQEPQQQHDLLISPEVAQAISDRWILEGDVAQVVEHCERYSQKVYDAASDSFFGHLKIGYMTLWVNYRAEGDRWRIIDAYSHRMNIEEGAKWIPSQQS